MPYRAGTSQGHIPVLYHTQIATKVCRKHLYLTELSFTLGIFSSYERKLLGLLTHPGDGIYTAMEKLSNGDVPPGEWNRGYIGAYYLNHTIFGSSITQMKIYCLVHQIPCSKKSANGFKNSRK